MNRRGVIHIELKGTCTAAPVAALIAEQVNRGGWSYDDFLVSSFDPAQLHETRQLRPEIRLGALTEKTPRGLAQLAQDMGAWSLHVSKRCVTPALVADAHQRGIKLFAFTVNQPGEVIRMKRLGVDGVFSDFPERLAT